MALALTGYTSHADQSGGFLSAIATTTGLNVPTGAGVAVWATNSGGHNALGGCTDTAGNTFTASPQYGVTGDYIATWYYCQNTTAANASDIFSVAITGGAGVDTNLGIQAWVITGQDTSGIDVVDGNTNSFASSPVTTPTFTTASAHEIIITAAYFNNNVGTITANNSFSIDGSVVTGGSPNIVGAHKIVSSIQTGVNMSFSWGAGTVRQAAMVLSFKEAGGGATSIPNKTVIITQAVKRASFY